MSHIVTSLGILAYLTGDYLRHPSLEGIELTTDEQVDLVTLSCLEGLPEISPAVFSLHPTDANQPAAFTECSCLNNCARADFYTLMLSRSEALSDDQRKSDHIKIQVHRSAVKEVSRSGRIYNILPSKELQTVDEWELTGRELREFFEPTGSKINPLLSLWENSTNLRCYSPRKIKVLPQFDRRGLRRRWANKPLNTFVDALEAFRTAMSFRFVEWLNHNRDVFTANIASLGFVWS